MTPLLKLQTCIICSFGNVAFGFQWKPLNNAVGLGARVLMKNVSGVLIKILSNVVNLN